MSYTPPPLVELIEELPQQENLLKFSENQVRTSKSQRKKSVLRSAVSSQQQVGDLESLSPLVRQTHGACGNKSTSFKIAKSDTYATQSSVAPTPASAPCFKIRTFNSMFTFIATERRCMELTTRVRAGWRIRVHERVVRVDTTRGGEFGEQRDSAHRVCMPHTIYNNKHWRRRNFVGRVLISMP